MSTEPRRGNGHEPVPQHPPAVPGCDAAFPCGDPVGQPHAWARLLAALLTLAEIAVLCGEAGLRERAKVALVAFLEDSPPFAVELDDFANLAIADLDEAAGSAAAHRLRERRDALAALWR